MASLYPDQLQNLNWFQPLKQYSMNNLQIAETEFIHPDYFWTGKFGNMSQMTEEAVKASRNPELVTMAPKRIDHQSDLMIY